MSTSLFPALRDPEGRWPTLAVFAYVLLTYGGGWALLIAGPAWSWAGGVLLLAHGLVIAAYLMHECAHNAVFAGNAANVRAGRFLNMVCGSNYGSYEDLRRKHLKHHIDNCDVVQFDYRELLKRYPALHAVVRGLEWCYVPAVEYIMHSMQWVAPFLIETLRDQRARVLRVLFVRAVLLGTIAWFSPWALLGYFVAYTIFITVLRFMDAFQHDYELHYRLADASFVPSHKGDAAYEQGHTCSNLISLRWPWLNLLVLNFPYHNAHHARPTAGWFKLPALSRELEPMVAPRRVSFRQQLVCFHRQRMARVIAEDYGSENLLDSINAGRAVGVNAVSFLTAF